MDLQSLFRAAALLFFVFDPLVSVPIFVALTKKLGKKEKINSADKAIFVAGILFLIFALAGNELMAMLNISAAGFKMAGGIVLLLLALQTIFGIDMVNPHKAGVAWVMLATPVLTGPGVMTSAIILASKYGYTTTLFAGFIALFITWMILRNSAAIIGRLGLNFIEVSSKVIGLLTAAMAVEFLLGGGIEFFNAFRTAV